MSHEAIKAARADLAGVLRPYLSAGQRAAMLEVLAGEEGAGMADLVRQAAATLAEVMGRAGS